tara:strand:- start:3449 stop:3589 length:141 start_codon:yes stop_codon:yes gene_type:complete
VLLIIVKYDLSENTIIMFKEKPAQGMSYSAEFIFKSLRDQYSLNEE